VGAAIACRGAIPVYLLKKLKANLGPSNAQRTIRRADSRALGPKMASAGWAPDYGPKVLTKRGLNRGAHACLSFAIQHQFGDRPKSMSSSRIATAIPPALAAAVCQEAIGVTWPTEAVCSCLNLKTTRRRPIVSSFDAVRKGRRRWRTYPGCEIGGLSGSGLSPMLRRSYLLLKGKCPSIRYSITTQ